MLSQVSASDWTSAGVLLYGYYDAAVRLHKYMDWISCTMWFLLSALRTTKLISMRKRDLVKQLKQNKTLTGYDLQFQRIPLCIEKKEEVWSDHFSKIYNHPSLN